MIHTAVARTTSAHLTAACMPQAPQGFVRRGRGLELYIFEEMSRLYISYLHIRLLSARHWQAEWQILIHVIQWQR
jgi:hypothetical protein